MVETLLGEGEEAEDEATSGKDVENKDVKNEDGESQSTEGESSDTGSMSFPGDGEMPDMSSMPSGSGFPGSDSTESGSTETGSTGEETGRGGGRGNSDRQEASGSDKMQMGGFGNATTTVTTYIPVGVTVHTATDVSTTFSRLASGDLVKILVETNEAEEDVILEIWMLQ